MHVQSVGFHGRLPIYREIDHGGFLISWGDQNFMTPDKTVLKIFVNLKKKLLLLTGFDF